MNHFQSSQPLFIIPQDVWLFRDGKPFEAGSDHRAASLFPPMPTVIQGMLRRLLLDQQHIAVYDTTKVIEKVGTRNDFGKLRLRGPWICKDGELFFELPADTYPNSENTFRALNVETVDKNRAAIIHNPHNFNNMLLPPTDVTPHKPKSGLVSQTEMQKYFRGESFYITPHSQLFERELRHSTAIEGANKRARDGHLFQVEFIRPLTQVGLYVEWMAGLDQLKPYENTTSIGGEAHLARIEKRDLKMPIPTSTVPSKATKFKLILLTPTYFTNGWCPTDWNAHFEGGKVTLQAAAVNRYISVGGFDIAQQTHKPALRYVPAGSVYYFAVAEGTPQLKANQSWLCDKSDEGDLGQIGFGQVAVAAWT